MSKSTPGKLDRDNARREREMGRDRQAEGKVEVYLANATQASGGTGPGVVRVPGDEAARLVKTSWLSTAGADRRTGPPRAGDGRMRLR